MVYVKKFIGFMFIPSAPSTIMHHPPSLPSPSPFVYCLHLEKLAQEPRKFCCILQYGIFSTTIKSRFELFTKTTWLNSAPNINQLIVGIILDRITWIPELKNTFLSVFTF